MLVVEKEKKKKIEKVLIFFFECYYIFESTRKRENLVNRTNVPLRRWSCDVFGILDTDRYSYIYEDSSYRENAVLAGIQKIGLVSRLARVHTYLCVWIEARAISKTATPFPSFRKNVCNSLTIFFFSARKWNIRRVIYSLPSKKLNLIRSRGWENYFFLRFLNPPLERIRSHINTKLHVRSTSHRCVRAIKRISLVLWLRNKVRGRRGGRKR